jgi:hypothetical protein
MLGHIENDDIYVVPGHDSIWVEPVVLRCDTCHSERYPNYRNDFVDYDAISCLQCIDKAIEQELTRLKKVALHSATFFCV